MQFGIKTVTKFLLLLLTQQMISLRALRQSLTNAKRLQRGAISGAALKCNLRPVVTSPSSRAQQGSMSRNRLFRLGALAAMASTTAVASSAAKAQAPVEIFRSDYKPSDFYVSDMYMSFQLDTHESIVTTTSQMTRSISPASKGADLILDGEDLDLIDVKIGGVLIAPEIYKYEDGKLRIPSSALPSDVFELQTSVRLKPDQNLALSGLYKSGIHL